MNSPHALAFPYRRHLLVLLLIGALLVGLLDPRSDPRDRTSDALGLVLLTALGYGAMRLFVWAAVRPLASRWPRLALAWGLIWFYGAIPLSLIALYVGTRQAHAVMPNATTVASVVAIAASVSAGAFAAIRAATSRLTIAGAGREAQ
jgi:hypothetical protein